jgi:chaperonin cofactor prefoldin
MMMKSPRKTSKATLVAEETTQAHKDMSTADLAFRLELHRKSVEVLEEQEGQLTTDLKETREQLSQARAAHDAIKAIIRARR